MREARYQISREIVACPQRPCTAAPLPHLCLRCLARKEPSWQRKPAVCWRRGAAGMVGTTTVRGAMDGRWEPADERYLRLLAGVRDRCCLLVWKSNIQQNSRIARCCAHVRSVSCRQVLAAISAYLQLFMQTSCTDKMAANRCVASAPRHRSPEHLLPFLRALSRTRILPPRCAAGACVYQSSLLRLSCHHAVTGLQITPPLLSHGCTLRASSVGAGAQAGAGAGHQLLERSSLRGAYHAFPACSCAARALLQDVRAGRRAAAVGMSGVKRTGGDISGMFVGGQHIASRNINMVSSCEQLNMDLRRRQSMSARRRQTSEAWRQMTNWRKRQRGRRSRKTASANEQLAAPSASVARAALSQQAARTRGGSCASSCS